MTTKKKTGPTRSRPVKAKLPGWIKPDKPRLSVGRPPIYTDELADKILRRLSNGESLRAICEDKAMPDRVTVYAWLDDPTKADFSTKYARARQLQADAAVDDCQFIADTEPDPNRARVRIGSRQWLAERMAPKKYGAKLEVGGTGRDGAIQVVFQPGDEKIM